MKPPNHGKQVKVTDPFLEFKGHLIYTPANIDGRRLGLAIRTLSLRSVQPLIVGDRIEIIP